MFYPECARLADLHCDLAPAVARIDALLKEMGDAEIIRVEDIACMIGADPNQVSSVFDYLAEQKILSREEMVECGYCGMVTLREDYQAQIEEDGEYPCSECDRPVAGASARFRTTYRRGEAWKITAPPPSMVREKPATYTAGLDEGAYYTHVELAHHFGVEKETLRKRLERFRHKNLGSDWQEIKDRRPREPQYRYRLKAVRRIIDDLLPSGQSSSERPAR